MVDTRLIMGMPITVEIADSAASQENLEEIFNYFKFVDQKFSTYKESSEISQINTCLPAGRLIKYSGEMQEILALCEHTRVATKGYFNILHQGKLDPSGLVKGWAILKAANLIKQRGFVDYYIEAGGDIEAHGKAWTVGIRNPFDIKENIKVIQLKNEGMATSGTYFRGQHIYNPFKPTEKITDIVSLTVVGPNVYEADRFATAAFAMGKDGIKFIAGLPGFAGYQIDAKGVATLTPDFEKYVI